MDADTLEDGIEADYETELSRLGSSKALYAVTGGEMDADPVLRAMAGRYRAAAAVLDDWAATDDPGAGAYAETAAAIRTGADRLLDATDDPSAAPDPTPLEAALADLDDPAARGGGLLAWALVTDRTLSQVVGFFVGNASTQEASMVRELRSDIDDALDTARGRLDDGCGDDDAWGRARTAAGDAIEAAYALYVDALESMGIKVKPVC